MNHIHIDAKDTWAPHFEDLWHYRDLIKLFTKRNFIIYYKQTILGPAWIFITPLISSLLYMIVFGNIAQMGTEGVPQFLFYLSGQACWNFFASCLHKNGKSFTVNANLFGKVYFPRLTVPISEMLTALIEFGIRMSLVLVLVAIYVARGVIHPNWWCWLLLPVMLFFLGIMGTGIGILISAVTVKYRDISLLFDFAINLWMYITPVVYPLSQLGPGKMRTLLLINPVTAPMEFFRYTVLGTGSIQPIGLAWSAIFAVVIFIFGSMVFSKVEKTFMDTV